MRIFKKRQLTPEELEEKSRREKEWADKCYKAGERFGRKYDIGGKIARINEYANRYPKTFFLTLLAIIFGCFFLNWALVSISFPAGGGMGEEIRTVTVEPDRSRDPLEDEINSLYREMEGYAERLERYSAKDSLTREDSVQIGRMVIRMQQLNGLIRGKEKAAPAAAGAPGGTAADSLSVTN